MRTIKELNARWWYRLLKVFYVGLIILFIVGGVIAIFDTPAGQQSDYYVSCLQGNHSVFNAYRDKKIALTFDDSPENAANLSGTSRASVEKLCGIDSAQALSSPPKGVTDPTLDRLAQALEATSTNSVPPKTLDLSKYKLPQFYVSPTIDFESPNYLAITLSALLALVIFLLIGEVLRRSFYYVVLGKIRPPKE